MSEQATMDRPQVENLENMQDPTTMHSVESDVFPEETAPLAELSDAEGKKLAALEDNLLSKDRLVHLRKLLDSSMHVGEMSRDDAYDNVSAVLKNAPGIAESIPENFDTAYGQAADGVLKQAESLINMSDEDFNNHFSGDKKVTEQSPTASTSKTESGLYGKKQSELVNNGMDIVGTVADFEKLSIKRGDQMKIHNKSVKRDNQNDTKDNKSSLPVVYKQPSSELRMPPYVAQDIVAPPQDKGPLKIVTLEDIENERLARKTPEDLDEEAIMNARLAEAGLDSESLANKTPELLDEDATLVREPITDPSKKGLRNRFHKMVTALRVALRDPDGTIGRKIADFHDFYRDSEDPEKLNKKRVAATAVIGAGALIAAGIGLHMLTGGGGHEVSQVQAPKYPSWLSSKEFADMVHHPEEFQKYAHWVEDVRHNNPGISDLEVQRYWDQYFANSPH